MCICEIHPYQNVDDGLSQSDFAPKAVILSGGPRQCYARRLRPCAPQDRLSSYGVPILGICYGQQVMMQQLGGKVEGGKGRRGHR